MGHNLGMRHDFDKAFGGTGQMSSKNKCNLHNGIMSYTQNANFKNPWSSCSKSEFVRHYNKIINLKMPWCMEGKSIS